MSEQEKTQEQQQPQQEQTQETQTYKTQEELENEIQRRLLVLFNKDNFLATKYFVNNCINENLEVEVQTVVRHKKIEQFFQLSPKQFEFIKKPYQLDLWKVFYQQVEKCPLINWNRRNNTLAPKFNFERSCIVVRDVEVFNIEKFTEFVKQSEVYKVLEVEEGENKKQVGNLVVSKDKYDQKIIINGNDEKTAQQCFQWLLDSKFEGKEIKDIQMQRLDYYADAYYKLYQTKPTGFKKPQQPMLAFQSQQQQMMQQQMMMQQMNMYYNHQSYRRNQGYKQFNGQQTQQHQNQYHGKRNYNNYNNNNNYNSTNYQGRNGNNKNFKNRNNNYHGNRHQKQSKPININDHNSFPGLSEKN